MALTTPPVLLEPIASDAASGFITNPMPETPTGTNAASIQGGFPPVTMQDINAGGKPPLGQDENGFLFLLSSHTLWVESGQLYPYNADISTAIGGYPVGTVLGMADGSGSWLNTAANNTSNPDAGGAGWVALASYGFSSINVTGGTRNLAALEYRFGLIILAGTLAANQVINFPNIAKEWLVINATTGAFTTTLKTAGTGSTGVSIPQGSFSSPLGIYCIGDGNIYPTVAPLGVPIDQNPTALTLVERTNLGYVLATYFNSNAPQDNLSISSVITEHAGDGFFRKNTVANFESQLLLQAIGGQVVNGQVPLSAVAQWASSIFASAALTGVPTAPTAANGSSSTQIATTAFVNPFSILGPPGAFRLPSGQLVCYGLANPNGGTVTVTLPGGVSYASATSYVVVGMGIAGSAVQSWVQGTQTAHSFLLANTGGQTFWVTIGV